MPIYTTFILIIPPNNISHSQFTTAGKDQWFCYCFTKPRSVEHLKTKTVKKGQ